MFNFMNDLMTARKFLAPGPEPNSRSLKSTTAENGNWLDNHKNGLSNA